MLYAGFPDSKLSLDSNNSYMLIYKNEPEVNSDY